MANKTVGATVLLTFILFSSAAWSMEFVQTKEGKVLLQKANQTASRIGVENSVRDPFKWAPELIDKFSTQSVIEVQSDIFAGLQLTGIMWDENSPLVVINNMLLQKGESIEGATVTDISDDAVVLEKENQQRILRFTMHSDIDTLLVPQKEK